MCFYFVVLVLDYGGGFLAEEEYGGVEIVR
jgi:hypothetical protein